MLGYAFCESKNHALFSLFYKNDCSEFDFVLLSEIFDEIVEKSKSREFIEILRETAKKYPNACEEYNIITCIDEAEGYF